MVEALEIKMDFKQTNVGIIPSDWEVKSLGQFGVVSGRVGWKGYTKKDIRNSGPYAIGAKHIDKSNRLDLSDPTYLSIEKYLESPEIMVFKEDILIVQRGSIGKVVLINREIGKATINPSMVIFRLKKNSPVYVFYYLISSPGQNQIIFDTSSTGVPMITQKQVSNFKIPLPPTKAEQTAIATALNDADALITQLEILIAKKRAIKQGAMQELLKPKDGWEVKNLGQIADIRRGASPRPIKDPKWFSDSGRGWIRISDVTSSNVYLNSTTQYLSEDGARNSVAVNRGDLIMSICATIGIPIIINIPACIHDGFVLFQNYEKELDTFFLYFCLQVKTEILTGKGQPGTQKNLNTTIVGDIEIDYPDVDEQRKIGLILRNIDIEISGLENKLNKYKMIKQGMMQNLLTGRIRLV